ncbi:MAG: sulfotransferase domain-containing protein [Candidatus Binataceae bacterium]
MFGGEFDNALAAMRSSLQLYRIYRRSGQALLMRYDQIKPRPLEAIRKISRYLALGANSAVIRQVANETSFERMRQKVAQLETTGDCGCLIHLELTTYDPETLLNLHHIRNISATVIPAYGAHQLSAEQLQRVAALRREFQLED